MVVETTQKCISKKGLGGGLQETRWVPHGAFSALPPRATMALLLLLLLGTVILPRNMSTSGWGSSFLMLCEVSLLPAAVWAAH